MSEFPSPRKRKGRNTDTYRQVEAKEARAKDQEYDSPSGKNVAAKQTKFDCRCGRECLVKIGEDYCLEIFTKLYEIPTKDGQDLYLQVILLMKMLSKPLQK